MSEPERAPRLADPSSRLEATFREAATRMQGLPIFNPAIEVEAVGFAPWQGHWLGVLITPWFMNLTLLPGEREGWTALAVGAKRRLQFPAGVFEFISAADEVLGDYLTCSLFSPMQDFADHATARQVAQLARQALFDAAHAVDDAPASPELSPQSPAVAPVAVASTGAAPQVSKRDFLRGRTAGGTRGEPVAGGG